MNEKKNGDVSSQFLIHLDQFFQNDSNIQIHQFKSTSLAYCKFLVQMGAKLSCQQKTFDSFFDSNLSSSLSLLHSATLLIPYPSIVILHWKQENIFLFFGMDSSVSKIRAKQFSSQVFSKDIPNENKQTMDLLSIICDPKKLNLAVYLCAFTLKKVVPSFLTYYFYPFQDSPNDVLLQQIDSPILTSYTIYRTLLDSGYVQKISKYNKYGVLHFTHQEEKQGDVPLIIPLNWFPYHIEKIQNVLGEGTWGCTLLVQLEKETQLSVVKILVVTPENLKSEILTEIDLHDLLDTIHLPQIPRFIGAQEYKSLKHFEREFISLKKIKMKCPKITEMLKETKNPIYTIAMSAATGGSIMTFHESRPLEADVIQSIIFQLLFTFHSLEETFGFIHRDLSLPNILFSDLDKKQKGIWKYQYQSTSTWWVPMSILIQVIDFGLSMTEKRNDPNRWNVGTPGYIHPLYFGITKGILWKWTVDWYAIGKHVASLALKTDITKKLSEYVKENDQMIQHISDQEEKELVGEWITELFWLAILEQKVNLTLLKKNLTEKYEILLGVSFFDQVNEFMIEYVPKGKKLLFQITQRLGEESLSLLQHLCRWEYQEASALSLLLHPYFKNFQFTKSTSRSFSHCKETIQI